MFTLTEVSSLYDAQTTFRILKPWWDVFKYYIARVMLMLAIFVGAMQLSKDQVLCLPETESLTETKMQTIHSSQYYSADDTTTSSGSRVSLVNSLTEQRESLSSSNTQEYTTITSEVENSGKNNQKGHKTYLDYQQYVFINQMCYHVALPWYSKYFPYLALIHTIILMVSSNFWFKYPKTCSKIEHFVSILGKCFESPWTTKALSETAKEETAKRKQRTNGALSIHKNISADRKKGSPMTSMLNNKSGSIPSAEKSAAEVPPVTILDKKDREQAKALFEKVRKFRSHVEDSNLIYKLYVVQTIVKTLTFIWILCYTLTFATSITFVHRCTPAVKHLTGYAVFFCTHNMAFMLIKLLISYIAFSCIYGIVCLYTLFWLFWRPLQKYSYKKAREEASLSDIPDVKNDFAFLLHMVDQYDQLYSKRFGIFLSEVSESKLQEFNLNDEWTLEKLSQHVITNAQNKKELHLSKLSGIPVAVFDLTDLEVLKLDSITEAKIKPKIQEMISLLELHLYYCQTIVEDTALNFLCDHLKCLHLKFIDERNIPSWTYSLRNLQELHLIHDLSAKTKMIAPGSLKELSQLKSLYIMSNLSKLPASIADVSSYLTKLVVQNDGTKLVTLNILKKMTNIAELELQNCELERIPHAIFSLTNLQDLDLKSNNIQTINEIVSFQHLHQLTSLKLWYNEITQIPSTIYHLKKLEKLYLNNNKLEILPAALFKLRHLKYLDVSYNSLKVIPPDVGHLQNLQYFAVTGNKLQQLPSELFRCTKLRSLNLGLNRITSLSEKIGNLVQLTYLDLKENCLDRLPSQLGQCHLLKRSSLIVEDHLFAALPSEIKDVLDCESDTTTFVNGT
ncbi:volume-regulated anion channel subunit LRRC8D [Protopterus annectens]|uniref:volume-regulated anion channel subunit LRRC8D n=1 Tax=Protopterus annectens TaxID=7888 RepID=UPI001CFC0765|nr:volume-regulated anion channel subunit LRRC8D [Protopterus annectens]